MRFEKGERIIVKNQQWLETNNLFSTDPSIIEPPIRKGKIVRMAAVPGWWWVEIDDVPGESLRSEGELKRDYNT